MPNQHPFQDSFWSPTSSIDGLPNFSKGFNVLHDKLKQSSSENKVIREYIKQRIAAERSHAFTLSSLTPIRNNPFDKDIGGGLKRCFEVVFTESEESSREHESRADNLHTTALDPLSQFSSRYDRIITQAKQSVEAQMQHLDTLCKHMEQAKLYYQNKCKSLLTVQPQYKQDVSSRVELGPVNFVTRDHVWVWIHDLQDELLLTKDVVLAWLETKRFNEEDALKILNRLVQLDFLKQHEDEDIYSLNRPTSAVENRGISGFLGRWSGSANNTEQQRIEMVAEMWQADKNYQAAVEKVEKMRIQVEQVLFSHYEEMESLELERIQTIKQAFISVAASLSNTIPRCKETFDNMMLYQETLKPDKDVQLIVEQYRTGQFCPRPVLYESYFNGTAVDQLFGVSLEEITREHSCLVPPLISHGLSVIESGFSKLYDEEKNVVWTTHLPLDRVHAAREEINHENITLERLQKFDLLLLASLIRLYLMELPECLFTFELYEPCKLIYANQSQQDKDSRLVSISKLLATLPTSNYHTVMALLGHFHKLAKELKDLQLSTSLSKSFSYILMRPQIESKVSVHERYSQKLIQDLIENYDAVFTKESSKAQEENSNRTHIVVETKNSNSLDNDSTRTSTSSSTRRSSILSNFMRSSQSTPTSTVSIKRTGTSMIIPMPSSSTLFEDPDEMVSSQSSIVINTPPSQHSISSNTKHPDHLRLDELASLDSFFEDEDEDLI